MSTSQISDGNRSASGGLVDAAAQVIHPRYVESQDAVLKALSDQAFSARSTSWILAADRGVWWSMLEEFPAATATVVDQVGAVSTTLRGSGWRSLRGERLSSPQNCRTIERGSLAPLDAVV